MSAHGGGTGGPEDPGFGGGPGGPGEPGEAELQAALEEQMRRLTVEDVVVQTVITLVNLSARKLALGMPPEQAAAERDLEQARLGIDAARAMLPIVPGDTTPIRDALSQLQIAYAREAGGATAAAGGPADQAGGRPAAAATAGAPPQAGPPPGQGAAPSPEAEDEAERAKARAKIWTPPGA